MEKVKLNKDQIVMFENHVGKEKMLLEKYMYKNIPTYIDNLTLEDVAQCILGNYELEKTPEEEILEYYIRNCEGTYSGACIKDILNILEIKINGINA